MDVAVADNNNGDNNDRGRADRNWLFLSINLNSR